MVKFDRKKIFTIIENFLEAYNNALNLPEEDLHINDNKNQISNKESHDRINLILGLAITITYVYTVKSLLVAAVTINFRAFSVRPLFEGGH